MVAGGSGVVPLRSMLRHRDRVGSSGGRGVFSARSLGDVIYREELVGLGGGVEVILALTRQRPDGWERYDQRVDAACSKRSPGLPTRARRARNARSS